MFLVKGITGRGKVPGSSAVQVRPGGAFQLRDLAREAETCAVPTPTSGPLPSLGPGDIAWGSGSAPERQVASLVLRYGAVLPSPRWPNLLGVF